MNWLKNVTVIFLLGLSAPAFAGGIAAKLYKNPNCGCCEEYAKYLRANGYDVTVIPTSELPAIKRANGVPERLEACHTTLTNGYVFEGHVPAESINRVMRERPIIRGLSVPGMPAGSPGMTGAKKGPLEVFYLQNSPSLKIYESR